MCLPGLGAIAGVCIYSRGKKNKRKDELVVKKEMHDGGSSKESNFAPSAPESNMQMGQRPAVVDGGDFSQPDAPPAYNDD